MRPDQLQDIPPSRLNQHTVLVFTAVAAVILLPLILFARFASGEGNPRSYSALTDVATVATAEPSKARLSSGAESLLANPETSPPSPPSAPIETAGPQPLIPVRSTAPPPAIDADAYVIMERSCGALLAGHNERQRMAPASLTKIITAMVVHKRADLNAMVEVSVSGSEMAKKGSSVMGLEPRMSLSTLDLLYGLFLPSGNDAALALAQHVSGDVRQFVTLMNEEAARLGLRDTRFANPHGLDAGGHYSTALDMAKAGRAFLDDPLLAQISVTPEYMPDWSNGLLKNGNKLLNLYPGTFGVKIGYTTAAKQTIVAAAERDGREVIVSLLRSEDRYSDSIALFDWAFDHTSSACPLG